MSEKLEVEIIDSGDGGASALSPEDFATVREFNQALARLKAAARAKEFEENQELKSRRQTLKDQKISFDEEKSAKKKEIEQTRLLVQDIKSRRQLEVARAQEQRAKEAEVNKIDRHREMMLRHALGAINPNSTFQYRMSSIYGMLNTAGVTSQRGQLAQTGPGESFSQKIKGAFQSLGDSIRSLFDQTGAFFRGAGTRENIPVSRPFVRTAPQGIIPGTSEEREITYASASAKESLFTPQGGQKSKLPQIKILLNQTQQPPELPISTSPTGIQSHKGFTNVTNAAQNLVGNIESAVENFGTGILGSLGGGGGGGGGGTAAAAGGAGGAKPTGQAGAGARAAGGAAAGGGALGSLGAIGGLAALVMIGIEIQKIPFKMVISVWKTLINTAEMLNDRFTKTIAAVGNWSAALIASGVETQLRMMSLNIERARKYGPGLASFEQSKTSLEIALIRLGDSITMLFLPVLTGISNFLASLIEDVASIVEMLKKFFSGALFFSDQQRTRFWEFIEGVIRVLPILNRFLGDKDTGGPSAEIAAGLSRFLNGPVTPDTAPGAKFSFNI